MSGGGEGLRVCRSGPPLDGPYGKLWHYQSGGFLEDDPVEAELR